MVIIRIDRTKDSMEEIVKMARDIRDNYNEEVICIPSSVDLLFNSSVEDLEILRDNIDGFIIKQLEEGLKDEY